MAATTEPVLRRLEDPATLEVSVLALHSEVHHGVNHVLELVGTSHLATLVHLADDHGVDVVLLAVVGDHPQGTLSALAVGVTIAVLTIVHALEAVDDEEERLSGVLGPEGIAFLQQCGNMRLLANRESGPQLKAFDHQLHLVEALLCSVEDHRGALTGQAVGHVKHHRGLTGTRLTGKEGHH